MTTPDDSRRKFEEWYGLANGWSPFDVEVGLMRNRRRGEAYDTADMTSQWIGWQARDPEVARLRDALKLFTCASMSESRPGRGESFIGWQKGDGISASERLKIAIAALAPQPREGNDA